MEQKQTNDKHAHARTRSILNFVKSNFGFLPFSRAHKKVFGRAIQQSPKSFHYFEPCPDILNAHIYIYLLVTIMFNYNLRCRMQSKLQKSNKKFLDFFDMEMQSIYIHLGKIYPQKVHCKKHQVGILHW